MKTNCNLRLLASDVSSLLKESGDHQQDAAHRAQTMMSLYSQNLSGLVLLLSPESFEKYSQGVGGNSGMKKSSWHTIYFIFFPQIGSPFSLQKMPPDFFQICNNSTEFHFEDIDVQLRKVSHEMSAPKPGDFFITRHSNLPLFHVVFHLVVDVKCECLLDFLSL